MSDTTVYEYQLLEADEQDIAASMTRLERTALHESAHCLTAASLWFSDQRDGGIQVPGGVFLTHVSVIPTEDTWGSYGLWGKTDSIETLNAVDLAGGTATYLATGSMSGVLYDSRGDIDDFLSKRMKVRSGDILSAWGSLLTGESSQFADRDWYKTLAKSFVLCTKIIFARWHEIENSQTIC